MEMLSPLQYEYSFTILEIQRSSSSLARWWRMVDDKKISGVYNVHCADLSPPSVQIMHYTAIQSAMNALFPHTTLLISWHLASLRVCYLTFEHLGPAQSFVSSTISHAWQWRWMVRINHYFLLQNVRTVWLWFHLYNVKVASIKTAPVVLAIILCSIFEYLWSFMCF